MALLVFFLEIAQEPPAVADHLEHAAAGVIVLAVFLEMLGHFLDFRAQNSDLDLWGASIALVRLEFLDDRVFFFG